MFGLVTTFMFVPCHSEHFRFAVLQIGNLEPHCNGCCKIEIKIGATRYRNWIKRNAICYDCAFPFMFHTKTQHGSNHWDNKPVEEFSMSHQIPISDTTAQSGNVVVGTCGVTAKLQRTLQHY